jgi:pimeloyl-ACP methyl ester carboxylesterase
MMMTDQTGRTEYLDIEGGRIAYDVAGDGPLVVLSPGMADTRNTYRFLAPLILNAGYRVASVDLRGHGESSVGWSSYTHVDTAGDLMAVIRKLGGPAVIMGQSFSGGATTIAAATNPDLVRAIVEIDPFTRPPQYSLAALLHNVQYRRGALLLARFIISGSVKTWSKYLDVAYPGRKPADWNAWLAALQANLREPNRAKAAQKMVNSMATLKEAAAQLSNIRCPALVVMGDNDSDFPDPEAEAAAIVRLMPAGLGRYKMIKDAGHYPHAEYPQEVAAAVVQFLREHV